MTSQKKVCVSWSGGKDSAMMLYEVLTSKKYDVLNLFTTVSKEYDRISMHGVRKVFLKKQSEEIGIPIEQLVITSTNYAEVMEVTMKRYKKKGVEDIVFGDIFLEDVRKYREEKLSIVKMNPIFPLWGVKEDEYFKKFVKLGFKAVITCVDSKQINKGYIGRELDLELLMDLKKDKVSVCGENGEYHSFVYDGPIFKNPIKFKKKEVVFRDNRFYFIELVPEDEKGKK